MTLADLPPRLASKIAVNPTTGCWEWTGAMGGRGYSQIRWEGRKRSGHRLAYELVIGPVPGDLTIDHLCRVRHCVNPTHMEPVPGRVNTLRGEGPTALNARKSHCINGHELSGSNLFIRGDGYRGCRICTRQSKRLSMRRARQQAARS